MKTCKQNFIGICAIIVLAIMFTACPHDGNGNGSITPHTHDFSGAWQKDATDHWKVCAAGGETGQKTAHTFTGGICTVCGYEHIHQWSEWAASTVWGMETRECSGCTETGLRMAPSMLAEIPAGSAVIGDTTEGTYTAILSAFKMLKYEVTQAQYEAVTGDNPSYSKTDAADGEVQEKRPVESVTWYDAIEFCNKLSEIEGLAPVYAIAGRTAASGYPITSATVTADFGTNGYRLPSEAQWEYACRAGTTTTWFHGDAEAVLENYAWYDENSGYITHEVGKKTANAFGLYDMHGNVGEWCWGWYNINYPSGTVTDYTGPASGTSRIWRGGGYYYPARTARSSFRSVRIMYMKEPTCGFRLALP
jgi:formylglycine-generating enzyme required for sulfatase activity